jgi:stage II sporulation SpoE-like protein
MTDGRPELLAALILLLEDTHLAPPEHLATVAAEAGALLGVRLELYLIDYDQRELVPARGGPPLEVNGTLAGRAFRLVCPVAGSGPPPQLWVPLLDGVERLGVLGVTADDPATLADPALREHCRLLGRLTGHLVTTTTHYGDGLDAVRRRRPRSAAAELVWQLLPPLTAGTANITVSALLEPTYEVGGDVFDYALSGGAATVAIFDAMGHELPAGLLSAAALGAYRAARRAGSDLDEVADAVEAVIAARSREQFVTGVLADLDLATGRLRYVVAGHPAPLLLRAGKVVGTLRWGRRMPFGLGGTGMRVGETTLEPGDWLVLHTDGVTEARDPGGELFGDLRLVDFLEREAASGHPAPETLRRLMHAVLAHQHGALRDDASIVLAHWHPGDRPAARADTG